MLRPLGATSLTSPHFLPTLPALLRCATSPRAREREAGSPLAIWPAGVAAGACPSRAPPAAPPLLHPYGVEPARRARVGRQHRRSGGSQWSGVLLVRSPAMCGHAVQANRRAPKAALWTKSSQRCQTTTSIAGTTSGSPRRTAPAPAKAPTASCAQRNVHAVRRARRGSAAAFSHACRGARLGWPCAGGGRWAGHARRLLRFVRTCRSVITHTLEAYIFIHHEAWVCVGFVLWGIRSVGNGHGD